MADDSHFAVFREFLAKEPSEALFEPLMYHSPGGPGSPTYIRIPKRAKFYCDHVECGNLVTFNVSDVAHVFQNPTDGFVPINMRKSDTGCILEYWCGNCGTSLKIISLVINTISRTAKKVAEWPPGGPPIPRKLLNVVGNSSGSMLIRGYQLQRRGFGLGAVSYYRRVVEDHWKDLLKQARAICVAEGASEDALKIIDSASKERSFGSAVQQVKDVIPQSLYIKEHNPFTLLHSEYSEDLHGKSDEVCLESAKRTFAVLARFSAQVTLALREDEELNAAIKALTEKAQGV